MKTKLPLRAVALSALLSILNPQLSTLLAQGTAFTYQGRLDDGDSPANGIYDLRFTIYDSTNNPGTVTAGPLTNSTTSVSNGLFTVTLDPGIGVFDGNARWLEIALRTNGGGAFIPLTPRQQITATPYAVTAANVTGVIPSGALSGVYSNAVTFNNGGNVFAGTLFSGTFNGNGSGLNSLNASQLSSGTVPDARLPRDLARTNQVWLTGGNGGTSPASGNFLGTTDFQPLELRVNNLRAARIEPTINDASHSNIINLIHGSPVNFVAPGVYASTISGGGAAIYQGVAYTNSVASDIGTIAGGVGNAIGANSAGATISGGSRNRIQTFAPNALIAGGVDNTIQTNSGYSMIGGGCFNTIQANSVYSIVVGGYLNTVRPNLYYSTLAGGVQNIIGSPYATIGGGGINTIGTNSNSGTISGGYGHAIRDNSFDGTIGGGSFATIGTNSAYATIGGGRVNSIGDNAVSSTIGGGQDNTIRANATHASIGGGLGNVIDTNSPQSLIAGGAQNWIQANAQRATICGGWQNLISNTAVYATIVGGSAHTNSGDGSFIGGGFQNAVRSFAYNAFIGGGAFNTIQANAVGATIGGGYQNTNSGQYATIAGGTENAGMGQYASVGGGRGHTSTGEYATVAGGGFNQCSGFGATVSGGFNNFSIATYTTVGGGNFNSCNGPYATVPGGFNNLASGQYSLAAGHLAYAQHDGTFAWAGGATNFYRSTVTNMFNVYSANGASFDYAGQRPDGRGNRWVYVGPLTAGSTISAWNGASLTDGGVWNNASDKNRKTDFKEIDRRQILERLAALPVREWRYTNEVAGIKHFGPTAQDFKAAFGLGADDKSIGTIDADGVALAAIQGLNQKLEEQRTELKQKQTEISELKQRLEKLERLINQQNGGAK